MGSLMWESCTPFIIICIPGYNKYELGKNAFGKEFSNLSLEYLNNMGKRNYKIVAKKEI